MCGGRDCGRDQSRRGHRSLDRVVESDGGLGSRRWGLRLGGCGGRLGCRGLGLRRRGIWRNMSGYVRLLFLYITKRLLEGMYGIISSTLRRVRISLELVLP